MIAVYVMLINKGLKTIDDVPDALRDQVQDALAIG